jgi:hypothetical protein
MVVIGANQVALRAEQHLHSPSVLLQRALNFQPSHIPDRDFVIRGSTEQPFSINSQGLNSTTVPCSKKTMWLVGDRFCMG